MTLIACLRILLNDVDPQPMRHIEVPLKTRLDRLHEVVQAAMGWTDTAHRCRRGAITSSKLDGPVIISRSDRGS